MDGEAEVRRCGARRMQASGRGPRRRRTAWPGRGPGTRVWPVSYRATVEGGIRARLASSARVRPARSRASRISAPRVRDMCIGARRNPLPDDCRAPCKGAIPQRVRIPPGNCRSSR